MTLKDLKIPYHRNKDRDKDRNKDVYIAVGIVDILFGQINDCLQKDRSRVKLNAITKGIISGVLGRTRNGTKEYLEGMYPEDLKRLLDDIEKELAKR